MCRSTKVSRLSAPVWSVLAITVAITCITVSGSTHAESATASKNECQSGYGTANRPTSLTPYVGEIPRNLPANLRLYNDRVGHLQPVPAPIGWHCYSAVYGDGSSLVVVSRRPLGMTPTLARLSSVDSALVSFYFSSTCESCLHSITCGLDPHIWITSGLRCVQSTNPIGQRRFDLPKAGSGLTLIDNIGFYDPAGVKGAGQPSGTKYPSLGVLSVRERSMREASIETCEMPEKDQGTCRKIDTIFAQEGWELGFYNHGIK
jgi:hypothetical protein